MYNPRAITRISTGLITRQFSLHTRRYLAASAINMSRISDAIKKDHRELEEYYNNIIGAQNDDEATRWQNQFTWELARHSIGEELVVYPAFEKNLGDRGKQLADKDRAEHQTVGILFILYSLATYTDNTQVKEQLKKFQNLKAGSPEFISTIKALMADLAEHIKEEEEQDLPTLDQALTVEDSESMAKSFGRTKAFVPSRSHPSAPNKPPFETAVGLLVAPIDHLADLFRKFPDETVSPNPSSK
jgi:hemerythrin-like domain-containing protein